MCKLSTNQLSMRRCKSAKKYMFFCPLATKALGKVLGMEMSEYSWMNIVYFTNKETKGARDQLSDLIHFRYLISEMLRHDVSELEFPDLSSIAVAALQAFQCFYEIAFTLRDKSD